MKLYANYDGDIPVNRVPMKLRALYVYTWFPLWLGAQEAEDDPVRISEVERALSFMVIQKSIPLSITKCN